MGNLNEFFTIFFSVVGSFLISLIALFYNMRHNRKQAILNNITQNRINWISNLRNILKRFILAYISNADETELRKIKVECELYLNDKPFYNDLVNQMELCCITYDSDNKTENYKKLIRYGQYIIARDWEHIKIESDQSSKDQKRISKEIDKRTEKFRVED